MSRKIVLNAHEKTPLSAGHIPVDSRRFCVIILVMKTAGANRHEEGNLAGCGGAYKFKPGQKPQLRFDILQQVSDRLPGFPIVLHGASSVIQADVETVNRFGGKMPDAIGIPEEMLRHAAEMAVCKINIDSDLRLAMTAAIRQHMFEHPDHFDPRQYLTPARDHIRELVRHKMHDVLGCSGKA